MSSYCLSTENDCGKNTFHIFAPTLELWGKAEKNGWSLFWSFVGFISCGFRAHVWRQILSDLLSSEKESKDNTRNCDDDSDDNEGRHVRC